ncbi:acyl-CoA dehydrogenase [Herbaspirillum lusitanum]|uniref:acyl-CoA dehydrogenase family protein n=1 Tax=Herbaspirillum lusitanum TaxID=213312 RepID=UPI0022377958|nr:acyl-CoA dehydrogenase family protein [Herbaspirillum lusitanum]MCW5296963.1 acyl-CoA dehydrogenase [Herbaspirillum lusitanum]
MTLDQQTRKQFVAAVERFVAERLLPNEALVEEQRRVPDDILGEMAALGLFGLSIPERWGGLGLGMEDEVAVLIALCRANLSFRSAIGINNGVGSHGLLTCGSDAQRERYLARMAAGEMIAAFCLTEPDCGSDAAALRTSARLDGDEWVLNGVKRYITNAPSADVFTVIARTDADSRDHRGLSAFIVERGAPGLSIGSTDRKMGLHGSHTADVIFSDCRIPADAIIGEPGLGFTLAMSSLNRGRLGIAAAAIGTGRRLIEEALDYATERRAFGEPIAQHQLIQAMLADSETELLAAQCMVEYTARRFDQDLPVVKEASCCKLFATETAGKVADRVLQIFGGAGFMSDYPIERIYRDVRVMRIYEGTSQIQQLLIAKQMLKEHALRG